MKKEPIKRYSQAFKQQVVREYETGASIYRLQQRYGIGAHNTVKRWIEQYGRSGFRAEVVHIQTVEDQIEFQAMKQRIAELESALAQSVLENRMLAATIEVASQSLGLDLKKFREEIITHAAGVGHVSKRAACDWFGISRQAYYQAQQRQQQRAAEDQLIIEVVQGIRQRHPRMGGRKLHHELQEPLAALGITRGRDALFDLLRTKNLLVPTKRSRRKTTQSGLWRCTNLMTDLTVTHVHQVWVGDITYITTEAGFVYLALLTDVFSRFIVGFDLSSSLAAEGCLRALNQAIAQANGGNLSGLIHHSDHGVQYTAWPYRERLQDTGMLSSMGKVGNCYENALAERVNGILKCEYGLDDLFIDQEHAQKAVQEAVWLYDYERPHQALNYRKPAEIYFEN